MNPGIEYYRPYGDPATGTVTVNSVPAATPNIVVAGITYTYGTHFVGETPQAIAESLTAAINADRNRQHYHTNTQPIGPVFAIYYGPVVRLIATNSGQGSYLNLTTTDSTAFTLSGASLAATYIAPTHFSSGTLTIAATGVPQAMGALNAFNNFRWCLIRAATANVAPIDIAAGPLGPVLENITPGTTYVIPCPPGIVTNLNYWYVTGTLNDTAVVLYV